MLDGGWWCGYLRRSREGSDACRIRDRCRVHYFNPRSREGSDDLRPHLTQLGGISIHAPVKGATKRIELLETNVRISIHAPAKGATAQGGNPALLALFQSTLP